ncbi:hypothetical protein H5410_036477, partial [Solanum commersonii]
MSHKRGDHVYTIAPSIRASVADASIWSQASIPGATLEVTAVPDPLEAAIEVSVSDVWITNCMIVSSRFGKSLSMLYSRIPICSSSVSASDSSTAASSLRISSIVIGGISEVSGASLSSAASSNKGIDLSSLVVLTSAKRDKCPIFRIISRVILTSWDEVKEAGVGEDASIVIESISTSGDVSTGAALL